MAIATLDYTIAAPHYHSRADYSEAAIGRAMELLGLKTRDAVADVGAGTGKLTAMLGRCGLRVEAVEPCAAMRERGLDATCGMPVEWHEARAETLPFEDQSLRAVFYGACWHEVDQELALAEAERVADGICCLYNIRDTNDPLQAELAAIIRSEVPGYGPPSEPCLAGAERIEEEFCQIVDRETYLDAYRSWPGLPSGMIDRLAEALDDLEEVEVPYTTVAWISRFR